MGVRTMRRFLLVSLLLTTLAVIMTSAGQSQEPKQDKSKKLTSNQVLMRNKLVQMNEVLAGITLDNPKQIEDGAKTLKMISRATSWHIVDPTPRYNRLNKNFQEQTADLERHAHEKDYEAATLDLVRINITCTHCHQHMREIATRRK
jgi:hypothetical protein